MVRHFAELAKLGLKTGEGALVCGASEPRYIAPGVVAHPVWNL